ncbi:JAB domain-containing protein similar to deubiquitination enzymes [Comamonas sp. BIGb0124]|uniref:Mov34/MPN/PAD-1 family protein n=1 Tax=Comamonas sp. BIGb0124 TaxID=2485130 RepID=UPI000F4672FC|nr:JAB domain-containing protein similar to deubiquitination enzymes [Comamonas sp. BIGb0124]
MIEIQLTLECAAKLLRELRRAGTHEIGGILVAEHVANSIFRIVDLSVQRNGGSFSRFSRDASLHKGFMRRFHNKTRHQYSRYNYLGEWHSHPSFPALPSSKDILTMCSLLTAPDQVANFLVLLIVKRSIAGKLEASAHAFAHGLTPIRVPLAIYGQDDAITEITPSTQLSLRQKLALRANNGHSRGSTRDASLKQTIYW